jgi:hypothetical protein
VYRAINSNVNDGLAALDECLFNLTLTGESCILAGDININMLDKSTSATSKLLDLLSSYGLSVNCSQSTRSTAESATCIDRIACSHLLCDYIGIAPLDCSDHDLLVARLNLKTKTNYDECKPNKTLVNYCKLNNSLLNEPWG